MIVTLVDKERGAITVADAEPVEEVAIEITAELLKNHRRGHNWVSFDDGQTWHELLPLPPKAAPQP